MFSTLKSSPKIRFGEVRNAPKLTGNVKASTRVRLTPSFGSTIVNPYKTVLTNATGATTFKRRFSTAELQVEIEKTDDELGFETFKLIVPLTRDRVLFRLTPETTVQSFLKELKEEDSTIQNVALYNEDGARLAQSTTLESVVKIDGSFKLVIDHRRFLVNAASGILRTPRVAGGVDEFDHRENRITEKLADLKKEFIPIYLEKLKLDKKASRTANLVMYGGLGFLVTQWCVLARLTWWDFNWDVMEPVTYFITFGTAVLGYLYYTLTKREYTFTDLRDTVKTKRQARNYARHGFDVDRYFDLEYKLRRVDPDALQYIQHNAADYAKAYEQALQENQQEAAPAPSNA